MNQNNQAMALMNCAVSGLSIDAQAASQALGTLTTTSAANSTSAFYYDGSGGTLWNYWQNQYYPYVIRESYPVYIQERAMDKGKHAFELLKALMDKKLLKIEKVSDFIEAMDTILKTL
jgi:hypothetical protein